MDVGRCTCVIVKEKSPDGLHGGAFYSLYTNVSFWLSNSSDDKTENLSNRGSVLNDSYNLLMLNLN